MTFTVLLIPKGSQVKCLEKKSKISCNSHIQYSILITNLNLSFFFSRRKFMFSYLPIPYTFSGDYRVIAIEQEILATTGAFHKSPSSSNNI